MHSNEKIEFSKHRPKLFPENQIQEFSNVFNKKGLLVINDFVSKNKLKETIAEIETIKDKAYHNTLVGNAYLEKNNNQFPENHIRNNQEQTSLSVLAYDQIPKEFIIRRIYENKELQKLISAIVNKGEVYHYSCPLGALNIAIMTHKNYLRWHFDESEFVVSIPLQDPKSGGDFEYVSNIRTEDDQNYDEVRKILQGDHNKIRKLEASPGSLVLFQGKHTIHRVSKVIGDKPRLTALLGFSFQKNSVGTDFLKEIRYGRIN